MKIPKKLKIGSHIYKVKYFNRDKKDLNDNLGSCHFTKNEIIINSNPEIAISQKEQTLFHEILEAISYLYQLKLNHEQISIVSEAYYQVLKDNNLLK